MLKDMLGTELSVNDWFVQAIRTGSNSPELGFGVITEINEAEGWFKTWVATKWTGEWFLNNGRQGKRTKTDNLIILGEMLDYLDSDTYYTLAALFDPIEEDDNV